eukprot:TRINITY_DN6286_c0_g1_i2.p1 TRINITY_DN6286_c0_g1~~TRINITY_DN6286_c0_g1_i2.p1  ORF type:complete len:139 (+),score=21.09 TRINITY_DN6286_c0_g1_i2:138-554(+)
MNRICTILVRPLQRCGLRPYSTKWLEQSTKTVVFHPVIKSNRIMRNNEEVSEIASGSPQLRLAEAVALVEALQWTVAHEALVPLRTLSAASFFSKGKLEEVVELCKSLDADNVVINSRQPLPETHCHRRSRRCWSGTR